jgi:hypothetical protein
MQAVITHPDGVLEGVSSDQAQAALNGSAQNIVRGSSRLAAEERLELYSRDYRLRLLDCLRSGYPALCHLLGGELFDAFALDYLREHPSRSYTLSQLGAGFPEHLDRTRPRREQSSTLILELAQLERAFAEVYDGPGVEGEQILEAQGLGRAPSAAWLEARFDPAPCLRLMRSHFPIGSYLGAVRSGAEPPMPLPRESFLALCRENWVVSITELSQSQYAVLEALASGHTLRQIDEPAAWEWLGDWTARGFFRRVAQ